MTRAANPAQQQQQQPKQHWRRRLKERAKNGLRGLFEAGQHLGVDVLPRHFYSSIPDLPELRRTRYWRAPSSLVGVAGAPIDPQLAFAAECCAAQRERLSRGDIFSQACQENGESGYGPTEADFLYCFIATRRPPRIVQVGAGVSTAVIRLAAREAGYQPEIVCVDPYPTSYLRRLEGEGAIRLLAEAAQTVDLAALTDVGEGGLLFVDSTHAVRYGGEVNRIILEVLPRLPAGSFAHFHDIFFPYDYPRGVFVWNFFPLESTLLHAFLINNARFEIAASLSMLHYAAPERLRELLPSYTPPPNDDGLMVPRGGDNYDKGFPSATYLRCVR
jgi:hypothetical protein